MQYVGNRREPNEMKGVDGTLESGFTPQAAHNYIRKEFPDSPDWMCWFTMHDMAERSLTAVMGEGINRSGRIGRWRWERVPCSYPPLAFWGGSTKAIYAGSGWTGVVRFRGPGKQDFMLFSYVRHDRSIGGEYLVSSGDIKMLRRFADDLSAYFQRRGRQKSTLRINVHGGPDIKLDLTLDEPVYLPQSLLTDVETQVFAFFNNREFYSRLKIPYRRGFLFAGLPGTGKTLMIRRLVRECHRRFGVDVSLLTIKRSTDEDDIAMFFQQGHKNERKILILEDLDSLTTETCVTRASLLAQLDGLASMSGALVLGTTNHPEKVDPALTQRPSRFDRIWIFPLPDYELRLDWLKKAFVQVETSALVRVASGTGDWTFAYLKELQVTAGVMAMHAEQEYVDTRTLLAAYDCMQAQFKAARNGFESMTSDNQRSIGFKDEGRDVRRALRAEGDTGD